MKAFKTFQGHFKESVGEGQRVLWSNQRLRSSDINARLEWNLCLTTTIVGI